ncbi:sigma-54-dependent transcriptional regulator [Tardiphaga sp. 604_B6_N1_1]|uniref:sigma-54-dependent transcriptional regulator n=1 Tax=unclassified Tardiphaga TaxID=2631404 RepID=UPI003F20D2EE
MTTILIVDDEVALRDALCEAVRDLGHHPIAAASGREAVRLAAITPPDAALLDLRMPDMDGLAVLKELRNLEGRATFPIAIVTAYATAANTIEAMRLGAFDHLTKPIGREDLAFVLDRMLRARTLKRETSADAQDAELDLIGTSAGMRDVQKTIGLVADSDATVLITGETGTGKEVVARTIHRVGGRAAGPFVALNCAAIPPDLLESELFGHVRGAFTGAVKERRGVFRDADRGTLFLDEIGDMDLSMQAKILRAIQERVVTPVGGRPQRIDVRIVAATHRDLVSQVANGLFREDLYYRLNVVPIILQPLRLRTDDVLSLASHFLAKSASPPKLLSDEAAAKLRAHTWPGNVRELRNAMERVAVMCRSDVVTATDLHFLQARPALDQEIESVQELPSAIEQLERKMIAQALEDTKGNRAEAARRLGIHRQLLHAKAEKYGLGKRDASG